LNFGFLDDVSVGGIEDGVEEDVVRLMAEGQNIGLSLNISKCELISKQATSRLPTIGSFSHHFPDEANLLGSPLLTGPAMDAALSVQCENLVRAASRLELVSAHDALIILRNSLSAPKLSYTLRTSPCAG
jgi:hypothetical protein